MLPGTHVGLAVLSGLVVIDIFFLYGRTGLVTFADQIGPVLPAQRSDGHIRAFQEQLYQIDTDFREADYARLATYVRTRLRQRGLLVLFTNFMTRSSLER